MERRAELEPRSRCWIGIEADWRDSGKHPSEHLVCLSQKELATHLHAIGKTGAGKTNFLHHLIAQDVLWGSSFVILDLRGDLVSAALSICAGRVPAEKVKIIDLREKRHPFGFNPLIGPGEPYFHALNVLDVVEAESESWGVQLQETLRFALFALTEARSNLPAIEKLFHDEIFREILLERVTSPDVLDFWHRFAELNADKQRALASPVLNKVNGLFATPNLRATLAHPKPIDLGRHLDIPGSVLLISLAADELHSIGRMMGSLVLACLTREMFGRVELPETQRNPVRIIVDEFEHFGTRDFEMILVEGRRFGISLVLAHQTLSQLSAKLRSGILGNVGTKVCFQLGREDSFTMSLDFTQNRNAIDFTKIPKGCAIISRSGKPLAGVEINSPLFKGGRVLTVEGEEFRSRVLEEARVIDTDAVTQKTAKQKPPKKENRVNLEDWL
jgi:hypothetical protein